MEPVPIDRTSSQVTSDLIAWASQARAEQLPTAVRSHVCRLMLDAMGAALSGTIAEPARVLTDYVRDEGGIETSSIWGAGTRVPMSRAALVNAVYMHSFECDDLYAAAVIHGGSQVFPCALAVAEERAARGDPPAGDEFLMACIAGLEIGARVGLATGAEQLRRGFHPSPNSGLFSAAVTAGLLLGLDEVELGHAVGIAASSGGFLMAAQYGAMVKRLHPGRSAEAGVIAAQLAQRGFTGIENVLESPYGGFGQAYGGLEPADMSGVSAALGEKWECLGFSVKAYPSCGSNHTSIDALTDILATNPEVTAGAVDSIEVESSSATADHVGWAYAPSTVSAAQMNLPYTLAALVTDRTLFMEQYRPDRIRDPRLVEFSRRVSVTPREDIDREGREGRHHVRLHVHLRDGRSYTREVRHATGSKQKPLTEHQCRAKYRRLAGTVLAGPGVRELEVAVDAFTTPSPDPSAVNQLITALSNARVATT